jgi:hypothetical protein
MVTKFFFRIIFLCCCVFSIGSLYAQDQQAAAAAAQKAWMEYMTPGPGQKVMAESAGEWKYKMKMWMDPNGDPMVTEGTSSGEMILGGRYLKMVYKGTAMGMPFEGWMILGYDNTTHEVTSVWYDNFGTGTSIAKGTYDAASKTLTLQGSSVDPTTGKDAPYKQTIQSVSKDKQIMINYMISDKKEVKSMEVELSR